MLDYYMTIETGSENNCDSRATIELTYIYDDPDSGIYNSISTTFIPSGIKGGSKTVTFTGTNIDEITHIKFDMVSGSYGWCFDYFTFLFDMNNLWTSCTTVGYNSYDVIAIDSDTNMGLGAVTEITLDVRHGSSTLNCNFPTPSYVVDIFCTDCVADIHLAAV